MIRHFRVTDFRCLRNVELNLESDFNLVIGANASGKTSLLEALAYLGRGKSFRGADTRTLIRHGASEFVLFGETDGDGGTTKIGVRNSRDGLEVRIGGVDVKGAASLAEELPLQVIDPEIHHLIAGGPERRRRFLDWIAFHVEHDYLNIWRQFRRALKQRNATLKQCLGDDARAAWDLEFIELAQRLDRTRTSVLEKALESLSDYGRALLSTELAFEYRRGWPTGRSLEAALKESRERELQMGVTQVGPHRADIRVRYDDRQARKLVSRGQQKLLASSMVLAATDVAQTVLEKPLLLLLDDPAAELDSTSMERLMHAVAALGCQVVATSLDVKDLIYPVEPRTFHVEHGAVTQAS